MSQDITEDITGLHIHSPYKNSVLIETFPSTTTPCKYLPFACLSLRNWCFIILVRIAYSTVWASFYFYNFRIEILFSCLSTMLRSGSTACTFRYQWSRETSSAFWTIWCRSWRCSKIMVERKLHAGLWLWWQWQSMSKIWLTECSQTLTWSRRFKIIFIFSVYKCCTFDKILTTNEVC